MINNTKGQEAEIEEVSTKKIEGLPICEPCRSPRPLRNATFCLLFTIYYGLFTFYYSPFTIC